MEPNRNLDSVMETRDHFKNGASLKSRMSRRNHTIKTKFLFVLIAIAICLAGSATMFAQETGVVINGVKWATRNVDKPGTFATNPEDAGMFYQWNCRIGWSATNPIVNSNGATDWNGCAEDGTWKKSNDPCPIGWRIPTSEETKSLIDTAKVTNEWSTINGINGRKFTDKTSGKNIFLPFVGNRSGSDGSLRNAGNGLYWIGMVYKEETYYAFLLCHRYNAAIFTGISKNNVHCVRCVEE